MKRADKTHRQHAKKSIVSNMPRNTGVACTIVHILSRIKITWILCKIDIFLFGDLQRELSLY